MDANSWIDRLSSSSSSSSSSRRYQYALQSRSSDVFMGFEDVEGDNDVREEIQCPFCSGYFDLGGLCCHIGDEHPLDAKNGVCPVCGVRVGLDMVTHITLHHGNIFKMQRKRKSRKTGSISLLSLLRRELREANMQSNFGGSPYIVSSANVANSANAANAAPDPLLSSFILPMGDDLGINISQSVTEPTVFKKNLSKTVPQRETEAIPLSSKDKEERCRRCDFVQGMMLSTIFGDNL